MLALQQLLAVHAQQQQQQQQQSGGGLPSTNGASGRNNSLVWKNALRVQEKIYCRFIIKGLIEKRALGWVNAAGKARQKR